MAPIDANRAGYLKAVWPDLFGCVSEVWPAPGAREGLQKCGVPYPPGFMWVTGMYSGGHDHKIDI